jgi:hypothetical protein
LKAEYPGLNTICRKDNNVYDVDVCKKGVGKTQYGEDSKDLKVFDNSTICYKTSLEWNYHKII